jgi:hypothetical protein
MDGLGCDLKAGGNVEKTSEKTPERGVVTLCGTQGCCPTVDFTDPQAVVIRDDHGGKVNLTPMEWAELKSKFGN